MKKIIVILGPTATGKTALSTKLAAKFNGEIISADSMQIYKKMNIGTAKVTEEEKNGVRHHLIDLVEPTDNFSLADYIKQAKITADEIIGRGKIPFLVGGTGLYISTFIDNTELLPSVPCVEYREFLSDFAKKYGGNILRKMLKTFDSESYNKLHDADIKRITRAFEIYRDSGRTVSEYNKESQRQPEYSFYKIGLTFEDRNLLYEKINERVDKMMEKGLLDEVKMLNKSKLSETASQAIGYKQFFDYFNGDVSLEETVEKIKQESRQYAKRQITWFKKDKTVNWYSVDTKSFENVYDLCVNNIEIFLKV